MSPLDLREHKRSVFITLSHGDLGCSFPESTRLSQPGRKYLVILDAYGSTQVLESGCPLKEKMCVPLDAVSPFTDSFTHGQLRSGKVNFQKQINLCFKLCAE